ncbi:uncharacterized protein LOC143026917 [Oratosquilla oratoria]|uniref:uncharacterized protein LOC143026917 n=1 Tax=Oratosquilla oratoria TaxID=337810 RepID=UPI003F75BC30
MGRNVFVAKRREYKMFLQSLLCVSTLVVVQSSIVPYALRGGLNNVNTGSPGGPNAAVNDAFPNQNLGSHDVRGNPSQNLGRFIQEDDPRLNLGSFHFLQGGNPNHNFGHLNVDQGDRTSFGTLTLPSVDEPPTSQGGFTFPSTQGQTFVPPPPSQGGSQSSGPSFGDDQRRTSQTGTNPSGTHFVVTDPVTTVRVPGTSFSPDQLLNLVLTNVGISSADLSPFRVRVPDMSRVTVEDTKTVFNIVTNTVTQESTLTSRTTLVSRVVRTFHATVTVHTRPNDRLALPEVTTTKLVTSTVTNVILDPHVATLTDLVRSTLPTIVTTIVPVTSFATQVLTNTFYSTSTLTQLKNEQPETVVHTVTISTYAPFTPKAYN